MAKRGPRRQWDHVLVLQGTMFLSTDKSRPKKSSEAKIHIDTYVQNTGFVNKYLFKSEPRLNRIIKSCTNRPLTGF